MTYSTPHHKGATMFDIISEAREWLTDALEASTNVDFWELSDAQVKSALNRHYEGGWSAFGRESSLAACRTMSESNDCEFVQVNPHEWYCTVHQRLVIAGTSEPVSCPEGGYEEESAR